MAFDPSTARTFDPSSATLVEEKRFDPGSATLASDRTLADFMAEPAAALSETSPMTLAQTATNTQVSALPTLAPLSAAEYEATLMEPLLKVPEGAKEAVAGALTATSPALALTGEKGAETARGLVDVAASGVETVTSPGGMGILAAQAVPGLNVALDTALAASMAKSGAEKLGEASVTGDVRLGVAGAAELGMAALGAAGGTRRAIVERRGEIAASKVPPIIAERAPLTARAFDEGSATLAEAKGAARSEGAPTAPAATTAAKLESPIRENGGKTSIILPDGTALVGGRIHAQTFNAALERGFAEEQIASGTAAFTRPDGTSWDLQGNPIKTTRLVDLAAPAPGEPVGMGAATPSEFTPPAAITSTKNAVVDRERAARGLPPAVEPARRALGEAWDTAMARLDADPAAQDTLLASLRQTPRAVTDTENALILHRQIDLQNEHGKAARDLAQAVDDGRFEDAAIQKARVADLSDRLLDLYNIGKQVGTETGRGLNARKMLANEDFTLAAMTTERRAVNGGRKLTPREESETAQAQADIAVAIRKGKAKPGVEADFQLDTAKRKWAEKLAEDADANTPAPTRALMRVGNALNDVRTIVTSYDLSALLRQGKLALATRPTVWARAILPSLRAAASPLAAFKIDHEIMSRPNAPLYARSGLYLAEAGHKLTGMEEAFLTKGLARRIPGVKASERAYTTFLNKLRADLFDTFVKTLSRDGKTVTLPEAKVISNYINVMTGRGDLAKFNAAAVPMATIFFAPRYVASRFQYVLAQPLYYGALSGKVAWREGARARKLVAGEYARALVGLSAIYSLYALGSDQQNFDPYSSDFLKLREGNTRVDPFAGLQQATVLLSREIRGQKTTVKGKTLPISGKVPYGGANAFDVGTYFLRTKLAPVPGAAIDWLVGKNVVGEPVTAGSLALNLTVPITYQDILTTLEEQGMPRGTALTLLSFFGEGVQTYGEAPKRSK